jgi:hypothetical protein
MSGLHMKSNAIPRVSEINWNASEQTGTPAKIGRIVTFNLGVVGLIPTGLTKEINRLWRRPRFLMCFRVTSWVTNRLRPRHHGQNIRLRTHLGISMKSAQTPGKAVLSPARCGRAPPNRDGVGTPSRRLSERPPECARGGAALDFERAAVSGTPRVALLPTVYSRTETITLAYHSIFGKNAGLPQHFRQEYRPLGIRLVSAASRG